MNRGYMVKIKRNLNGYFDCVGFYWQGDREHYRTYSGSLDFSIIEKHPSRNPRPGEIWDLRLSQDGYWQGWVC